MHIIFALVAAAALLALWLTGHWFARVLAFLAFAAGFAFLSLVVAEHSQPVGALIGIALAWPVAGLPTYFWRWRLEQMTRAHLAPPPGGYKPIVQLRDARF